MTRPRLLVVEDDLDLREVLARGLRENGFDVTTAKDAAMAVALTGTSPAYDLMVLDVGLPDADGRDLCQTLRARGVDAPVLFLTAHNRVTDRLAGFAAGGDDYLAKPFHLTELAARLRALLKRAAPAVVSSNGVSLDPATHDLSTSHGKAALTPTEFRLLAALCATPGTVLRRHELVRAGWPEGSQVHGNTLDQYVARLRRKLATVEAGGQIETVRGVGYAYA